MSLWTAASGQSAHEADSPASIDGVSGMPHGSATSAGAPSGAAHLPSESSFNAQNEELQFFNFFGDLLVEDKEERQAAMAHISAQLTEAAKATLDDPIPASPATINPAAATPSHHAQLLAAHLPSVLRLALACPFPDVAQHMRQLLSELSAINPAAYGKYHSALDFAFQPSMFVPLSSCVDPTGRPPLVPVPSVAGCSGASGPTELLEDIFLSTGRTSHIDLLLAWHPSFLTQFTACIHHLMDDSGPLPHVWRNYIAIMAASRHHCEYLVALQEMEYLLKGGDPTWLKGIAYAPKKLQSLCELNALLAHQPWLLSKTHIASLVANADTDSWSIAELVHAIVIMSTFHSLCGFVFGMGLNKEIDSMDWSGWEPTKMANGPQPLQRRNAPTQGTTEPTNNSTAGNASVPASSSSQSSIHVASDGEHLLRMLSLSGSSSSSDDDRANVGNAFNQAVEEGTSPAHDIPALRANVMGTLALGMRQMQLDVTDPAYKYIAVFGSDSSPPLVTSPAQSSHSASSSGSSKHLATLKYSNFDVNSKAYSVFFLHEYSWKEHGYALVSRFYQGFAQMLDDEWDLIFALTYRTVSDQKNVDTTPFRVAIWYFTHRLFGLQHDDYSYNKIPVFLTTSLKTFVKKIACAPETINKEDYELKGYNFKPDEKCHIVLLTIEARRQASMLYALHSVMQYMLQQ